MTKCASRNARLWACAGVLLAAPAAGQVPKPPDLTELPLEELLKLHVTSASRKEQPLSKVGAALYVLTREDIASSGAHTIPDLLRLVPGVDVAQINSNQWSISIRGFNTIYSNKVLVLIDGRTVYQPSVSAVWWDRQDLPMEDIGRIEVIRGPGGTIWGANAMNGVINIITRHSRDTQGGLVTAGAGSWRRGEGLIQYGGTIGSAATYRAFGKYFDVDSSVFPGGQRANDGWHAWAGGFRSDWDLTQRDTLTVQGDLRSSVAGGTGLATFASPEPYQAIVNTPLRNTLGDAMGTWRHTLEGGSETTLRVYYEHLGRYGEAGADLSNDTLDVDFQHHLRAGARNDIVWGLDFRVHHDDFRPTAPYSFQLVPAQQTVPFFSGFFQDEIRLASSFFLTLVSKLEHNDFTGVEYEPGAQFVWAPSDRHTLWTSVGKAIRQPDRTDFGTRFDVGVFPLNGPPAVIRLTGDSRVRAEQLYDYEAGYRGTLSSHFGLDFAAFYSDYRHLETFEPEAPFFEPAPGAAPHLVIPLTFANLAHARNYGIETFLRWNPVKRWTISPGYSLLHMSIQPQAGSEDTFTRSLAGSSAKHQVQVRSTLRLSRRAEYTAVFRYVARLPALNIDSYATADTSFRWGLRDDLEASVSGQNLLSPGHLEFRDLTNVLLSSEVKRSVFAKLTWRF